MEISESNNVKQSLRCNSREMITIGAGGVGTSSLQFFFDAIAKEHSLYSEKLGYNQDYLFENVNTYFSEEKNGNLMARGIIIDSGKEAIENKSKTNPISNFFYENNYVTNSGETDSLYYLAKNNKKLIEEAFEVIRKEAEKCDMLYGFQVFNSSGGGAGSGYSSRLLEKLSNNYGRKDIIRHLVIPSLSDKNPLMNSNTLLSVADLRNITLNNILCNDNILNFASSIPETNKIIGKMAADISSLSRFSSNSSYSTLIASLIPYPRINFVTTNMVNQIDAEWNENQIIDKLYDDKSSLGYIDSENGKYITTFNLFRGNNHNNFELLNSLKAKSSLLKVCDFTVDGAFYHGFTSAPIKCDTCLRVTNHSSIKELLNIIKDQTSELMENEQNKNMTIGKCIEAGMEEGEYYEALEELTCYARDYEEVCIDTGNGEEEEEP